MRRTAVFTVKTLKRLETVNSYLCTEHSEQLLKWLNAYSGLETCIAISLPVCMLTGQVHDTRIKAAHQHHMSVDDQYHMVEAEPYSTARRWWPLASRQAISRKSTAAAVLLLLLLLLR